MPLTVILNSAENIYMNETWYGDQLGCNLLTDTVSPLLSACLPSATLIFGAIIWLKSR